MAVAATMEPDQWEVHVAFSGGTHRFGGACTQQSGSRHPMIRSSTPRVPAPGIDPQRQHRNRRRLAGVIDLARIYRNLGVKELADRVHRDKTRLIPETGNPKIDLAAASFGSLLVEPA